MTLKIGKIRKRTRFPTVGVRKPTLPSYPVLPADRPLTGGGIDQLNVLPEAIKEIARIVGERRAREVWKLKQRGIDGTLPELLTYAWLDKQKRLFEFQSSVMGGRRVSGGAVLDFVIFDLSASGVMCWRIQGEYWHQGRRAMARDQWQVYRIRQQRIGGLPVIGVVDLWENDVYRRYPEIFRQAEMGVGLRGIH